MELFSSVSSLSLKAGHSFFLDQADMFLMPHKISYRDRGAGPNLILLHGYGGSVHHWEEVAQKLSQEYRVIVPNLTHLYLAGNKLYFSVQVEALAHFLETHFHGEKFYVAGLSYGGALAWGLAIRHPHLVERLVLVNPVLPHPTRSFSMPEIKYFFTVPMNLPLLTFYLATPLGKTFLRRAAEIFRDERVLGAGRLENLKGRKLLFVANLIHRFIWTLKSEDWNFWTSQLSTSVVATALVYDPEDLLIKEAAYEEFAKNFLCEEVTHIVGAGHLASKHQPQLIAEKIHQFCQKPKMNVA